MRIRENMKATTGGLVTRNRAREALNSHFVVKECLPAEYHASVATQMVANLQFERKLMEKLDEMHNDLKQINDRLVLIQSKTDAILTQSYELHEFNIPRLFIVLPETPTFWNPTTMLSTKFRLYFICECGEHTKPANSVKAPTSKTPHELHLAKHEGYVVRRPTEFFKKYGPFLMVMLEVIKQGMGIAGSVVPGAPTLSSVTSRGIDYSLKYLEEIRTQIRQLDSVDVDTDAQTLQQDLTRYLAGVKGLEGADLRQLGSHLASSDNLLGNLYRMTTQDGHVKWVCRDHYRTGYQEEHTQKLRDVVKLGQGEFDEQLGRVTITLASSFAANEFYKAVRKGNGVLELTMNLTWECDRDDLEDLKDTLKKSRVSILRLGIQRFRSSLSSKLLSTSTRYDVFFHIKKLPNMRIIHVVLPKEVVKLPSSQSKRPSHHCKISFEMVAEFIAVKELGILLQMIRTDSILTILDVGDSSIEENGAQALSEALKTNSTLTAL
ncbi:hypothetical protein BGZ98_001571, partial [Dissophora globulifera]